MKEGYAICSITGKACRCESRSREIGTSVRACVDTDTTKALQWARTALLRLRNAADALDLAVDALVFERPIPGPEWRDKVRRINRLIEELEEETKA